MNCGICGDEVTEGELDAIRQGLGSMAEEEAEAVTRKIQELLKDKQGPACIACFTDAANEGGPPVYWAPPGMLEALEDEDRKFEERQARAYERDREARRHVRDD